MSNALLRDFRNCPPIIIMWCEWGQHHWAMIDSRYVVGWRSIPKHCPEHRKEASSHRISQAMRQKHHEYDQLGLPESRECLTCSRKVGHKVVKPASAFYRRKGKPRKDGTSLISLEPYCKECCKEKLRDQRKSWTPEERLERSRHKAARDVEIHGLEEVSERKRFYKEKVNHSRNGKTRIAPGIPNGADLVLPLTDAFCSWIKEQSITQLSATSGYEETTIRRWQDRKNYTSKGYTYTADTIKLSQADKLLLDSNFTPQHFWGDLTQYDLAVRV